MHERRFSRRFVRASGSRSRQMELNARRRRTHRGIVRLETVEEDRMTIRVSIDQELCIGTGSCVFHAPEVFDLDSEGIAHVIDETAATRSKMEFVEGACPVQAIRLHVPDPG